MIFADCHALRCFAALLIYASENKDKLIYIPTKKNGLTGYLENWFWDSKCNDIVLLHHSSQFDIRDWKGLRQRLRPENMGIRLAINELQFQGLDRNSYLVFNYQENNNLVDIKRMFDTIFFIGSKKVFQAMSGLIIQLAGEGAAHYKQHRSHDHVHMDVLLRRNNSSLCVDFYDEAIWN